MKIVEWRPEESALAQVKAWCDLAGGTGVLQARFVAPGDGEGVGLPWGALEPWTRTRAVTVAEIGSDLGAPGLDVALCSDFVYLRRGAELQMGSGEPTAGLLWALGRAGRAALARGLLGRDMTMGGDEAVRCGLVQRVLEAGESPIVGRDTSPTALTTARDLMRNSVEARPALELAAFKLLFSSGDPGEGARAFLERRPARFAD
jgi:enoyl-CoA hydratase/carnithine racemase